MRRQVLKSCHIYAMLKKSARRRHLSFHTPGHKKGKWDLTELSFSDNLSAPSGCIARAEEDIARILGAEKSFLLTDGSTSGVLSALFAAKELGAKKIAFPVSSHKSIWNGCALLGLTPLPLNGERFEEAEEADALFVTSPTYYGNVADLAALRRYCEENRKLLLVDGAHGGHLHFTPYHAGKYADIWVDGVHKSLPALTQGAVVSARTQALADALKKGVDIFRTTSPSYPIMASVEYAVKYPRNNKMERAVRAYAESSPRAVLHEDWTKLCILFGENAFAANAALEKRGIYAEFCDGNRIMFYLSPATKARQFKKLTRTLKKLLNAYPYIEKKQAQRNPAPLVSIANQPTEWVELREAEGRICAKTCGLFPPCTPLLLEGEKITKEKLELLRSATNVFGLKDKKILAVKDA